MNAEDGRKCFSNSSSPLQIMTAGKVGLVLLCRKKKARFYGMVMYAFDCSNVTVLGQLSGLPPWLSSMSQNHPAESAKPTKFKVQ